jgi:ubiquinone/menaquinone biosynthesis C-methylase UbiE
VDKVISNLHFRGMTLLFRVRDFIYPRERILEEAGIKPCFQVLDFGCGPGGYEVAAAGLVGNGGRVYALSVSDHHLGDRLVDRITGKGLFDQPRKGRKTYNFSKAV